MERIIDACRNLKARYEILRLDTDTILLRTTNNNLERTYRSNTSQYCIRLIKDGRMTITTLDEKQDPSIIAENLKAIMEYGTEVDFDFPAVPVKSPEKKPLEFSSDLLYKRLSAPAEQLAGVIPSSEISAGISQSNTGKAMFNSSGFNNSFNTAKIRQSYSISLKGTNDKISRSLSSENLQDFPPDYISELKELYLASLTRKSIPSGNYRVIFAPNAIWSLVWRINAAISGTNLLYGLTPLKDKTGSKVFSELLTIREDNEGVPFDDEASPTASKTLFDRGVFKGFIFDLYTASKTGQKSTGNGFKSGFWSASIDSPVSPALSKISFEGGNTAKKELFSQDKAILIEGVIGAHSGNIVQGQYSMGISLGFLVEDGKITSMIDGAMVSGNIYEDFNKIKAVSRELTDLDSSSVPYILFEDIPIVA